MRLINHRFTPLAIDIVPSALDLFDPLKVIENGVFADVFLSDKPNLLRELVKSKTPRPIQKHRIKIDCNELDPKSIKMEISEDKSKLIVSGKEGDDRPNEDGDFSIKEFRRSYNLPSNIDLEKMTRFLSRDGQLMVDFPIKQENNIKRKSDDESSGVSPANEDDESAGNKRIKLNFELPKDLEPSKIKVICKDRDVIVRAEDKRENEDGEVSQIFYYRRRTLPENTDFDAIRCTLEDNKLMITAPFNSKVDSAARNIPIENKLNNELN